MIDDIINIIKEIKVDYVRLESNISSCIESKFIENNIIFDREIFVSDGSRVDFLVDGGIAIEIKKGKPNTRLVEEQIVKYAKSDIVKSIILVSERGLIHHINETNGKPVFYISLSKNWGITV